jgi:predicted dinucleotide-binding enzyme
LVVGHSISGGELIAQWAPGAAVFKTFNTTGFNNMADLSGYPDTPVMFVAGDDSASMSSPPTGWARASL